MAASVLILGANGRVGLAAARAFDAAGWQVLAQVRRDAAPGMPSRARLLRVDATDAAAVGAQAAGVQAVLHALNPVYTRWEQEALPLARAAVDIAQRLGARFLLPGNVYNFGEEMPTLLRDDTPQHPTTRKGRIRVEMEAEIERRCAAGALRATVLRAGDFFGAGRGSWLDLAIVKSLRAGKLVYPGPTHVPHAWAYLPDLARAFVAVAGDAGQPAFSRLHFAGHSPTGAELLDAVEEAAASLGLLRTGTARRGGMPWTLMRLGALVVPMLREVVEMEYLWRVPHALDGSALARAAPGLAHTPLDEAVRTSLAQLFAAPAA